MTQTLAELMVTDVDDVFMNTDEFASAIIRYICGDSANVEAIVAVIDLSPVVFQDDRGRGYVHRADMVLNSTVTLNASDAIKYGDNRYEIEAIGDEEHGMRVVKLIRYQPETRGAKPVRTGGF